ncbi:DUF5666 domain-containing protein [Leifsonia shinshuensis]|uniref:DUF5666 domain-containing protein n=1 Tax=Leifsonia shinshuensis TaxID=150026 RepID=UPI002856EADF|nr:DUF5666 domain-containing protein [Leifsonia shinshuensis]MDR6971064.1 hypothetical protein [Leifsonia shinshuensis]
MSDNDIPTPLASDETRPYDTVSAPGAAVPSAPPAQPAAPEPFVRRHAVAVAIVAAVLAVIVVAGGTAWGVSAAVASTQTASAPMKPTVHAAGTKASARKAAASKHAKAHAVRGTITAISGDSWTVRSASGKTATVKLDSATTFGTKKTPATRDSFAVGDRIGVLGTRSGTTVTAKKIVHLHATSTGTPSPAPSA